MLGGQALRTFEQREEDSSSRDLRDGAALGNIFSGNRVWDSLRNSPKSLRLPQVRYRGPNHDRVRPGLREALVGESEDETGLDSRLPECRWISMPVSRTGVHGRVGGRPLGQPIGSDSRDRKRGAPRGEVHGNEGRWDCPRGGRDIPAYDEGRLRTDHPKSTDGRPLLPGLGEFMGRLYHLQQTKDRREKMGPPRGRVADDSLDRRLRSAGVANSGTGPAIDDRGGMGVDSLHRAS